MALYFSDSSNDETGTIESLKIISQMLYDFGYTAEGDDMLCAALALADGNTDAECVEKGINIMYFITEKAKNCSEELER